MASSTSLTVGRSVKVCFQLLADERTTSLIFFPLANKFTVILSPSVPIHFFSTEISVVSGSGSTSLFVIVVKPSSEIVIDTCSYSSESVSTTV